MLISHCHKFIFIHVYKAAGTSIASALRSQTEFPQESLKTIILQKSGLVPKASQFNDHITARELREKIDPKIFDRYFKFAFVRNPWDLQVSLYEYILKNKKHALHSKVASMKDFEEFIRWKTNQPEHKLRSFQKNFVTDESGKIIVDFIGRYENLKSDFDLVLQHLNLRAELPFLNKSKTKKYEDYYTSATADLIFNYYRQDIEAFGYQPPVFTSIG